MRSFAEHRLAKPLALMLALCIFVLGAAPRVQASFIASEEGVSNLVRQEDLARVRKAIEHKLVAKRLEAMGYRTDEIATRLGELSDEELHKLAQNVDSLLPAGNGLGLVIAVLVIVLLVILILKIADKKIVVS